MCDKYFSHFVSACPRTRLVDQIRLVVWNVESCIQPHNPLKTTHPYTGAPLPSSLNPQPPFSLTVRRYIPTSTPTPQTPTCFQLHMRASKRVPHLGLHTESTGILSPISPPPPPTLSGTATSEALPFHCPLPRAPLWATMQISHIKRVAAAVEHQKQTGRCATFDVAPCGETSTSTRSSQTLPLHRYFYPCLGKHMCTRVPDFPLSLHRYFSRA